MKEMTKANARILHEQVDVALKLIAEQHGLDYSRDKCVYGSTDCRVTGKFVLREINGVSVEKTEFARLAPSYGLTAADYKKQVTSRGEVAELIGFCPTRPRFCLRMRMVESGKVLLFSDAMIPLIKIAPPPVAS